MHRHFNGTACHNMSVFSYISMEHGNFKRAIFRLVLEIHVPNFPTSKEKVTFNQRNKTCFLLFCVIYVLKVTVHDLAFSVVLWMHLGSYVGGTVVNTRAFHLCDPGSIPAQCSYQINLGRM